MLGVQEKSIQNNTKVLQGSPPPSSPEIWENITFQNIIRMGDICILDGCLFQRASVEEEDS